MYIATHNVCVIILAAMVETKIPHYLNLGVSFQLSPHFMFLCLFTCVCNSAKRCSRQRISSAFLPLTCFISKDKRSQADRQTQSDKTAEPMAGACRET